MTDQKSTHTEKRRRPGEGLVLFIWNLLIGVLLLVFILSYVPFYVIRRLVRRIREKKEWAKRKEVNGGIHRQDARGENTSLCASCALTNTLIRFRQI